VLLDASKEKTSSITVLREASYAKCMFYSFLYESLLDKSLEGARVASCLPMIVTTVPRNLPNNSTDRDLWVYQKWYYLAS
jgi:hypothetical protein